MTTLAGILDLRPDAAPTGALRWMLAPVADVVAALAEYGPFAGALSAPRHARPPADLLTGHTTVVALKGRLHNRQMLAGALGIEADPETDASLVRRGYERWGTTAIERFRGRFAMALWDAPRGTLVLARDPIGHVPLYYHVSRDRLAFSSAVACLAALPGVSRDLNETQMAAYLLRRQPDPASTFLMAVNRLPPGHLLTFVDGQVTVRRHYFPRPAPLPAGASDRDYADALRDKIELALRAELPAGERVGIHLSGGLDSSALACLALRHVRRSNGSLVAASSVLPRGHGGPESDEESYLQVLEQAEPGLRIERVTAGDTGVFADLEDGFARLWSPVNAFHYMDRALARGLQRQGATAVLSGFGGDAGPSLRRLGLPSVIGRRRLSPVAWLGRVRRAASRAAAGRWPVVTPGSPASRRLALRYRTLQTITTPEDSEAYHLSRLERGIGPIGEEFLGLHASLGLDLILPYFNLDLLEFLAAVPARQFSLENQDRSLFRRAMIGVLPEVIRTRHDKHPYVPDFPRRLDQERPRLLEWLATARQDRRFRSQLDHYVDVHRIQSALGRVRPVARREEWNRRTVDRASTGLVAARFLRWFASN